MKHYDLCLFNNSNFEAAAVSNASDLVTYFTCEINYRTLLVMHLLQISWKTNVLH